MAEELILVSIAAINNKKRHGTLSQKGSEFWPVDSGQSCLYQKLGAKGQAKETNTVHNTAQAVKVAGYVIRAGVQMSHSCFLLLPC